MRRSSFLGNAGAEPFVLKNSMAFPREANVSVCTFVLICNIHSGFASTLIMKSFCVIFNFLEWAGGTGGVSTQIRDLQPGELELLGKRAAEPCTAARGLNELIRGSISEGSSRV